jgi:hypothetical protein
VYASVQNILEPPASLLEAIHLSSSQGIGGTVAGEQPAGLAESEDEKCAQPLL